MKTFIRIGDLRKVNIKVIFDDNEIIYEGKSEDAPTEIKDLKYSKIEQKDVLTLYVYSEVQ